VRVNGEIVTHFLKLETVVDDNVGKRIDLGVAELHIKDCIETR